MDNCSIHLSQNIISFMKEKRLKVLFTVPYESSFNPIELAFRFIKNKIYKKIFLNQTSMINYIEEILQDKIIEKNLFKNFNETLLKYESFIEKNITINLNNEEVKENC